MAEKRIGISGRTYAHRGTSEDFVFAVEGPRFITHIKWWSDLVTPLKRHPVFEHAEFIRPLRQDNAALLAAASTSVRAPRAPRRRRVLVQR